MAAAGAFGQALAHGRCCGPYLAGARRAPDPESLMRSRYTAFAVGHDEHLARTWDPATRPGRVGTGGPTVWEGLEVVAAADLGGGRGEVEFRARYRDAPGGRQHVLHERSRFRRVGEAWLYVDGDRAT